MVALMKVYQEEDDAYQELVTAATMFFQYLLQPFRNMREVATSFKLDVLKSLEEEDLGPKRIVALQKEAKEWTRRAEEAVVSIQDITVNYFKETVKALAGMRKQMEQDEKRFGQAAWATATPRLDKLKLMLARETLQLMRAKELCLNHKRAEIQGKMEDLPEQEQIVDVVDELEMQYYKVQLELYEVKFEILKYEEILLVTQLDSIKRLIKDKQDEVVYYDPCESPEELKVTDRAVGLQDDENLGVKELSRQCRHLESKRGRICARRAFLRNREDQCKEHHRLRLQQAEESIRHFHQHHRIQMKRDKIKEEEQKKKEWVNQEHQKTLQRLKAFKEGCPGPPAPTAPRAGPAARSLPGGRSRETGGRAAPPPSGRAECRDGPGNTPAPLRVPAGDPAHRATPDAPPPPPLPARPLSQAARPQSSPLRTPGSGAPAGPPEREADGPGGPGSMDEVLASLRCGRTLLQKGEGPPWPSVHASANENILAAIRQGVRLKKVHPDPDRGLSPGSKPPSDLERSIRAALQRIKRVSTDSEEEEGDSDGQSPCEWDC